MISNNNNNNHQQLDQPAITRITSPPPPFRKLLFFACFRFLIFHPFSRGVSWPHLPLCADAHAHFASAYQISYRSVKPLRRYRNFCDFQDGGRRHLGFSKIRNFNGRSAVRSEFASPCQISSKSIKRLQTYGDLTVFKMAAVRHLGFVKFEIFNGRNG